MIAEFPLLLPVPSDKYNLYSISGITYSFIRFLNLTFYNLILEEDAYEEH